MPPWTSAKVALKGIWLAALAFVVLASLAVAGVQTARLYGFKVWPIEMTGWIATADFRAKQRDAEAAAHRVTKQTYRNAQSDAARLEGERLTAVKAQQKEATDAIAQDYARELAALRARADQLRRQLAAGAGSAGAGGAGDVPGVPDATGGAAEGAAYPRLPRTADEQLARDVIATEQALQLEALIAWTRRQAAIDPNPKEQ